MRIQRIALGLAFAAATAGAAPADEPKTTEPRAPPPKASETRAPQRAGEVALRLDEGRRVAFTRKVTVRIEHKAKKETSVHRGECRSDLELVVLPPDDDGSIGLEVRVLRARGWWEHPIEGRTPFDTALAPIGCDSRARTIAENSMPGAFFVRADGRILQVEEQARAMTSSPANRTRDLSAPFPTGPQTLLALADFAATWPALPPRRMGAGTFYDDVSLTPWPVSPSYVLRLRHELKVLDSKRAVIETKGSVDDLDPDTSGGAPRSKHGRHAAPRVLVSGFAASSETDRTDGLVRKSSARFTLLRSQPFDLYRDRDGESTEGTASYEWEAVMERVPEAAAPVAPAEPAPAARVAPENGAGEVPPAPPTDEPPPR